MLLATLLGAIAMAGAAVAAQQESAPRETFRDELAVHLLTVQVTAETMTGRPVTDLRRDDFRIIEDGKPRELALFLPPETSLIVVERRPEGAANGEARGSGGEDEPSSDYSIPGLTVDAVSQADQRIVLGFDFLSMSRPHLKRAVEHCIRLLEEAGEAGGASRAWAVVVLGADPWMVLPYTTDRVQVARALDQVARFGSGHAFQAWARGSFLAGDKKLKAQQLLAQAAMADGSVSRDQLKELQDPNYAPAVRAQSSEQFAYDIANRLRAIALTSSTASLTDLFHSLGGDNGDRALVYFFSGAAENAVEMPEGGSGLPTAERQSVARKVLEAWRTVAVVGASAGFRVFGVDVQGLTFDPGYRGVHSNSGFGLLFDESRAPGLTELFPEDVALTLATGTGGKLIESNDFAAGIEAAKEAAAQTYVLGYQVNRPRDGKMHQVEIRVPSRPRLVLRYARQFLDLPPRQRLLAALRTSANLPKRKGRLPLVFQGRVQEEAQHFQLAVEASLPIRNVGLVRSDDARSYGDVEFFLAIYDRAGRLMDIQSKRSKVVANPESRSLVWERKTDIPAPPGTIAVAMYDHLEGRYAIASARLGSAD